MSDHERPIRNALLALLTCLLGVAFGALFCGLAAGNILMIAAGGALSLAGLISAIATLLRTARRMR